MKAKIFISGQIQGNFTLLNAIHYESKENGMFNSFHCYFSSVGDAKKAIRHANRSIKSQLDDASQQSSLQMAKDAGLAWHYKDKKNGFCLLLIAPIKSESESHVKYCWEYIRNYWLLRNKGMECFVEFLKSENMHGYTQSEAGEKLTDTLNKISNS